MMTSSNWKGEPASEEDGFQRQVSGRPHRRSRCAQLLTLYLLHATYSACIQLLNDAKMLVFLKHYDNDTARFARVTARSFVVCDLLCTVCSPLMGGLSSVFGRKSVLLFGAVWNLGLRSLDFLRPVPSTLIGSNCAAPPGHGIWLMVMTAMGDLFPKDPAGAGSALARLQIGQLAGSLVFPSLGAWLATKVGIRMPLGIGVALAGVCMCLAGQLQETLPAEKREKVLDTKRISPLGSFKVFTRGPKLFLLALAQVVFGFMDFMLLVRFNVFVNMRSMGWTIPECGRFTSQQNACSIPGLYLGGTMVKAVGAVPAMLLGSLAVSFQYLLEALWVGSSVGRLRWTLPLQALRGLNTAALDTLYLQAGEKAGLAEAELICCQQGLQMVVWAVGGLIWSSWYARVLDSCSRGSGPASTLRRFYLGPAACAGVQLLLALVGSALSAKTTIHTETIDCAAEDSASAAPTNIGTSQLDSAALLMSSSELPGPAPPEHQEARKSQGEDKGKKRVSILANEEKLLGA